MSASFVRTYGDIDPQPRLAGRIGARGQFGAG